MRFIVLLYVTSVRLKLQGLKTDILFWRYCLDLVATKWIQGSPGQRPTARFGHSAIVDQNARMWIYGGHSGQELVKDNVRIDWWLTVNIVLRYLCGTYI